MSILIYHLTELVLIIALFIFWGILTTVDLEDLVWQHVGTCHLAEGTQGAWMEHHSIILGDFVLIHYSEIY